MNGVEIVVKEIKDKTCVGLRVRVKNNYADIEQVRELTGTIKWFEPDNNLQVAVEFDDKIKFGHDCHNNRTFNGKPLCKDKHGLWVDKKGLEIIVR